MPKDSSVHRALTSPSTSPNSPGLEVSPIVSLDLHSAFVRDPSCRPCPNTHYSLEVLYGFSLAYLISPAFGLPFDSAAVISLVHDLPGWVKLTGKALLAAPFTFHSFNGFNDICEENTTAISTSCIRTSASVVAFVASCLVHFGWSSGRSEPGSGRVGGQAHVKSVTNKEANNAEPITFIRFREPRGGSSSFDFTFCNSTRNALKGMIK